MLVVPGAPDQSSEGHSEGTNISPGLLSPRDPRTAGGSSHFLTDTAAHIPGRDPWASCSAWVGGQGPAYKGME